MVISEQEYELALKEVESLLEADESSLRTKSEFLNSVTLSKTTKIPFLNSVEFSRRAMTGSSDQQS